MGVSKKRSPQAYIGVDDDSGAQVVSDALDTLGITTVTLGASATIQALLTAAGGGMNASVKKLTIIPAGCCNMALGGVASASTPSLTGGVPVEDIRCNNDTDLRFYAAVATTMVVIQEG